MPPGEVFCLRGKERAIARRPVDKDKGGFPGATIFKSQLDAVTNNCRHHRFSLFAPGRRSDGITAPNSELGVEARCTAKYRASQWWFGLLEARSQEKSATELVARRLYGKAPLFDRFVKFNVQVEGPDIHH